MKHLNNAKEAMSEGQKQFINITENNVLTVAIQNGTIPEAGVNGIQASDLIVFCKHLIESLDNSFPSLENKATIKALELASYSQNVRTKLRIARGVEGKHEA